ncbi:MAG: response regulator transcription factor [Limisphaerales bacterium]
MKKRILLIEDDAAVADYLTAFLDREGFEVVIAPSLALARQLLNSEFTLILLDLTLPDGTGDQFIPEIRQQTPSIPILMVTGAAAHDERLARCLQAGAIGYVNKGARVDEIAQHLRRALGN